MYPLNVSMYTVVAKSDTLHTVTTVCMCVLLIFNSHNLSLEESKRSAKFDAETICWVGVMQTCPAYVIRPKQRKLGQLMLL